MTETRSVEDDKVLEENIPVEGQDQTPNKVDNELQDSITINCETNKSPGQSTSDSNNCTSVLSISFSDLDNFNSLKSDTINFLKSYVDFDIAVDESNLVINVTKDISLNRSDWVIVDEREIDSKQEIQEVTCHNKNTKTKSKHEDLFVLDSTPSLTTKHGLQYECKFSVVSNDAVANSREDSKSSNIAACFNCGENHNLRDCSKPKNYTKINAARQKFKSQQTKSVRYHLEADQLYAHLKPGQVSDKLRNALGLEDNQLPDHIYLMRQLGYPPGWAKEIQPSHSELVLFDFDGKKETNKKLKYDLDSDMIVEYPGFNVPYDRHVKDEYRLHRCPCYSQDNKWNKDNMIKRMQCNWIASRDNLNTCDMEIDAVESADSPACEKIQECEVSRETSVSPCLSLLESKKKEILEQLSKDTGNPCVETSNVSVLECPKDDLSVNKDCETTVERLVKTTCLGTPIIKSASPYFDLPSAEKFSKDVSDVINFENLPNSTGHYEQLSDVLKDIRKSTKDIK